MRSLIILLTLCSFAFPAWAQLKVGELAPKVVLKGDLGGRLDDTQWSSEELVSGKVMIMFYVDPDESDLNNHVSDALKAEEFPEEKYGSIAIINMGATWLPNVAINVKLKSKQEKFPTTTYVKDLEKTIVDAWGVSDDNSNVLLFGKDGKLLYRVDGKYTDVQVQELIKTVRDNL